MGVKMLFIYISKKYKTVLVQPQKAGSSIYSAESSKSQPAPASVSVLFRYGFKTEWLQRRTVMQMAFRTGQIV